MEDQFTSWILEKERARKQKQKFDRFKFFSICCYPWILNAANKAELLKKANKLQ